MKILDSKFYQPKQILNLDYDNNRIYLADDVQQFATTSSPFDDLLETLLSRIFVGHKKLVMSQDKLTDFERCTDFNPVGYCGTKNEVHPEELCYFHPKYEIFIISNVNCCNEEDIKIKEAGKFKVSTVFYQNTSPTALKNVEEFFTTYLTPFESDDAKVSILLKEQYGLVFKTQIIKPYHVDLHTMYNDDFLPVHAHIKAKLQDDHKGVVLLHGIPGSGKTNYIKWLTSQVPDKQFIFVPTNMIGYLTDPEMMSMLIDNKNSVLVLEDCENYIAERTASDFNTDVVSSILNIADGMLSDVLECQFICTFNSDLSKIDDALLRKGRLIAEYQFGKLEVDKANAYLQAQKELAETKGEPTDALPATVDEPISLAELTNLGDVSYKAKVKESKIGFL